MKRVALLALTLAAVLTGCVVPGRAAVVATVPVPVVRHVHGPHCGHFWGYYDGRPVYYYQGLYSYWDGAVWVEVRRPPVIYHYRTHRPHRRYHYHHRVHRPHSHHERSAPSRKPHQARRHDARPAHKL